MKLGIMQPYIFPYIGYFQLINAVDKFVIYDNIKYTKKGWINRNRILVNGEPEYFSLPLKKDSDFLNVDQRFLSDSFSEEKNKTLRKLKEVYKKAPQFQTVYPIIETVFNNEEKNLFSFLKTSIEACCEYLKIETQLIRSSSVNIDHSLRSQEKVLAVCKVLEADTYINPIGGVELYCKEEFQNFNINLRFLKSEPIEYSQFQNEFQPWLSIIDVMMFNDKETIKSYLEKYSLN